MLYSDTWPIDESAAKVPAGWCGWPKHKQFSLVLTHDVDTAKGQDRCLQLIENEKEIGFRSSFNFVPERYRVSSKIRQQVTDQGFEIGVHGLNHDGKLYKTRKLFQERAGKINGYLKAWQAVGFRSPAMHHNLDWIHDLDIEYDASTFDTDPFEPQPDGVNSIFPFYVRCDYKPKGYVELPYTLPQDSTLFLLLGKNNDIWKQKLDWIASRGGMALINTHPDYMNFDNRPLKRTEYPASNYLDFLKYIKAKYNGMYWHVLPKQMASFWESLSTCSQKKKADGRNRAQTK